MTTEAAEPTRRVRGSIAALLTFLGWGVGLYYARREYAWRVAWISVAVGVLAGAAASAYLFLAKADPTPFFNPIGWTVSDAIHLGVTIILAGFVWRNVAQTSHVERASVSRLFGYITIIVAPLLTALFIAILVRTVALQPFRQPSGSMQPTMEAGQYLLVAKWRYGYSRYSAAPFNGMLPHGRIFAQRPQRGDVVVFRPAPDPNRDFVKRIVGLPGDRVQMRGGVVFINGEAVARETLERVHAPVHNGPEATALSFRETLPNGVSYVVLDRGATRYDNTREYVVPEDHYFVLGDDRDNSADSRVVSMIGTVPFENIIGPVVAMSGVPR